MVCPDWISICSELVFEICADIVGIDTANNSIHIFIIFCKKFDNLGFKLKYVFNLSFVTKCFVEYLLDVMLT